MVVALQAFIEFCYIARCDIHDTTSLCNLGDALNRYHTHCKILQNVVFVPMALIYLDNTPWFIMSNSSECLVLPMVCVLRSLNRSTSKQSRSHGDVPITSMLLDRCYLQINGLTNWQPHMSISLTMECFKEHPSIWHYRDLVCILVS